MYDCLELLDEIIEIYPIPSGTVTFPLPFQARSVAASPSHKEAGTDKPVSLEWLRSQPGMVVEAVAADNTHARTIIIEDKPTVKGSQKTSVAGRYFQMSVSAKSHQDTDAVQEFVNWVSDADSFDTFIVDASENIYVIRGVYPATSIELTTNLPLYKDHDISLSVECVNGLQTV